jgi:hypothetical protein
LEEGFDHGDEERLRCALGLIANRKLRNGKTVGLTNVEEDGRDALKLDHCAGSVLTLRQ